MAGDHARARESAGGLRAQADLVQLRVQRPNFQETTALGAALAAGYAVGLWQLPFLRQHPPNNCTAFEPAVDAGAADRRFARWSKAVQRSLDLADLAE